MWRTTGNRATIRTLSGSGCRASATILVPGKPWKVGISSSTNRVPELQSQIERFALRTRRSPAAAPKPRGRRGDLLRRDRRRRARSSRAARRPSAGPSRRRRRGSARRSRRRARRRKYRQRAGRVLRPPGYAVAGETLAQRHERPAEAASPAHAGPAFPPDGGGGPIGAGLPESLRDDRSHGDFFDVHGFIVTRPAPYA